MEGAKEPGCPNLVEGLAWLFCASVLEDASVRGPGPDPSSPRQETGFSCALLPMAGNCPFRVLCSSREKASVDGLASFERREQVWMAESELDPIVDCGPASFASGL